MRTSDFDYHLPPHMIAQTPLEPRDSSRLLALYRDTGSIEHRRFPDLVEYLRDGDVLVFNDSRVIPARLHARREDTGGRVEFLLLRKLEPGLWTAVGKPSRSLKPGNRFLVDGGTTNKLEIEVMSVGENGTRTVRLSTDTLLDRLGEMPLPPYIHEPLSDPERYQTVYARAPGSAVAPTAGLHFTPGLLESLKARGVEQAYITLHVGLDTFRPVDEDDPGDHRVHGEYYTVGGEAASVLNAARSDGRRIIAVGTTTVRVLEQAALRSHQQGRIGLRPESGWADLFILPGHRFRVVDAMITNFHLPRSTLLMLVSAFAGRELVLRAYHEAIASSYRFYSFGDAMLMV